MIEGVERYPLELVAPGHHGNVVFGFVFVSAAVSLWLAQQLTVMIMQLKRSFIANKM